MNKNAGVRMEPEQCCCRVGPPNGLHFGAAFSVLARSRLFSVPYLTCSKKLTDSQLSPPHGTKQKIKM